MISLRHTSMYVLVALALLLPAAAQAGPERTQQAAVVEWTAPTPAGNSVLAVPADSQLTILLGAQAAGGSAVRVQIRATQMPGGTFTAQDGNPAEREVHVDSRDLEGRRPPGDVHGSGVGPARRRSRAANDGHPRHQGRRPAAASAAGPAAAEEDLAEDDRSQRLQGGELQVGLRHAPDRGSSRAVSWLACVQHAEVDDTGVLPEPRPDLAPEEVPQRADLGSGPPRRPAEQLDRLGPAEVARPVPDSAHAALHLAQRHAGNSLPSREEDLHDPCGSRSVSVADAARRLLHARGADRLQHAGLRADRDRDQRPLAGAHRLARRRLHRYPRDEPAGDPARARVARLRPHEQRVRSCA